MWQDDVVAGGMTGGGWGRRGSGISLADRVRPGDGPTPSAAGEPSPARHCWVADAVDGHGVRRPGLLVEWRQVAAGWEGRVVYSARLREIDRDAVRAADPASSRGREWVVVEEWLPADRLTPP